jgi:hypothetical protein
MTFYAGGFGVPGQQVLVAVNPPSQAQQEVTQPGFASGGPVIPYEQTSIPGLGKNLGTDGWAYGEKDNNTLVDVTPTAGAPMYNFPWPNASAYVLSITANNVNLDDPSIPTPTFCVGQKVKFQPAWNGDPNSSPPNMTKVDNVWWHLPDKYVNEQWQNQMWVSTDPMLGVGYWQPYGSVNYRINSGLLTSNSTSCWYVNGSGGACSTREMLHFSNGQSVNIAAAGSFTVVKPALVGHDECENLNHPNYSPWGNPCLYLDSDTDDFIGPHTNWNNVVILGGQHGGYSRHWASYTTKYGGVFRFTQTCQGLRKTNGVPMVNTGNDYWLDPQDNFYNKYFVIPNPDTNGVYFVQQWDQPSQPLIQTSTSVDDHFKDFFQYQPAGDSIAITIGSVKWSWGFNAQYGNNSWTVTPGNLSSGTYQADDAFPEWTDNLPGQIQ